MSKNINKWVKIENEKAKAYYLELDETAWHKKRKEILQRDNYRCQLCDKADTILQVHHKRYLDDLKAWEYPNNLLITLCKRCHYKFHDAKRKKIKYK